MKGHVQREDLLSFLNGHRVANKLIEEERKERLSHLSKEESLREYIALCEFWDGFSFKEISDEFERHKISFLLRRRELLDRAGGIKK